MSSCTSTSVRLSWTDITCAANYTIMYTNANGISNTVTVPQSPYMLTIPSDTTYNISVAATDTGGRTGPYSDNLQIFDCE